MSLLPKNVYGEEYSEEVALLIKPYKVLGSVTSEYQESVIIETEKFGRIILQDGLIYLADYGTEAIAEMYTHIPMLSGKTKRKLLLIGAGDGAGIQRFLEYKELERIVGIDIDKQFVELCKKILPDRTSSFDDPRVEFLFTDGAKYIKETTEMFDVIAVTVGDPFTISKGLFKQEFLKHAAQHLNPGGIMSMDGYMPYYTHADSLNYWDIFEMMSKVFPIVRIAISTSPLMPGGLVTLIFGSFDTDVMKGPKTAPPTETVWYNKQLHTASFILPEFMRKKLKGIRGFEQ